MKAPYTMLINGQMVGSDKTFDVINPATEEVAGSAPQCSEKLCVDAIEGANKAFTTWQLVDMKERKACMQKISQIFKDHVDELSHLVVLENGKTLEAAKGEVLGNCWLIDNALAIETPPDVIAETEDRIIQIVQKPIGPMACITGWNYPFFLAVQKWAPAIVLGNTCIWKPSPYSPLSALRFAELARDVLPPGVLNIITDGNDAEFNVGAFLSNHPDIAKVSFTGSGPTGKAIYKACADHVKRFNLELGGNDCAIVRGDVDVQETAPKIFSAAFNLTGQVCVAVKRVLVHESIFDEFVAEMTKLAEAAALKMGDGLQEGIEYGPLANKMQFDKVKDIVEDAKKNGANIHCGGSGFDDKPKGFFYKPTIVTGVQEGVRLWDEEQFGPVLPIAPFKDDQEAVNRSNNSVFGLGGSVWSKDVKVANEMANKIMAGTVWVNQHTNITGGPFGGFKQSGLGREIGKADISAFTETQTQSLAK